MASRPRFLANSLALAAAVAPDKAGTTATPEARGTEHIRLDGEWEFRTDPENAGEKQDWKTGDRAPADWRTVTVPHTSQMEAALSEYRGVAWYRRLFDPPPSSAHSAVRIEFEAVFHSAKVWVNGKLAGEHLRKAYTAFHCD